MTFINPSKQTVLSTQLELRKWLLASTFFNSLHGSKNPATATVDHIIDYVAKDILTDEQYNFLKENFVVYDPITQTSHQDFSKVLSSRIKLMGEIHNTLVLYRIQLRFIQLFFNDPEARYCRLMEGLQPNVTQHHDGSPYWKGLPTNLVICGADIRSVETSGKKFLDTVAGNNLKVIGFAKVRHEKWKRIISQIAEILNHETSLQAEPSSDRKAPAGKSKSKKSKAGKVAKAAGALAKPVEVMLDKKTFRNIAKIWSERNEVHAIYQDLISKSQRTPERNRDWKRFQSNQGLAHEIAKAKASGIFSEIMAIWGELHFSDDQFFQTLDRDHIVLLHPEKIHQEAVEENEWQEMNWKKGLLHVVSEKQVLELEIPEKSFSLFSPSIQALIKKDAPKEERLSLTPEKVLMMFRLSSKFTLPSGKWMSIEEGLDTLAVHRLIETDSVHEKLYQLVTIFNQILLFDNKQVEFVNIRDFLYGCNIMIPPTYSSKFEFICNGSEEAFIQAAYGPIATRAQYLVREMHRQGREKFTLLRNQSIFFSDVSPEEAKAMVANFALVAEWFTKKAPSGTVVELEGENIECRLAQHRKECLRQAWGTDLGKEEGFQLVSPTGFSFVLKRG